MRELTMDEMDWVSGGQIEGENENTIPELLVVAARISGMPAFSIWGDSSGGTAGGGGGSPATVSESGTWDRDGDGVADYQDEDPDDPNNNTLVVDGSNAATEAREWVKNNWATLTTALATWGTEQPGVNATQKLAATTLASILGTMSAEDAGNLVYHFVDSATRGWSDPGAVYYGGYYNQP